MCRRGILFPTIGFSLLVAILLGDARPCFAADGDPNRTLTIHGLGHGTADIDGPWQFSVGDNLAWAQPTWDDSAWATLSPDAPWGAQGHPSYTGVAWYRRHLNIIPAPGGEQKF